MPLSPREVDLFEASRARLEAIAYRLLGSAGDAEDAVQDAVLRWQAGGRGGLGKPGGGGAAGGERTESPGAWLPRVLPTPSPTQLPSAPPRRETYVGQWLPEPVLAGD